MMRAMLTGLFTLAAIGCGQVDQSKLGDVNQEELQPILWECTVTCPAPIGQADFISCAATSLQRQQDAAKVCAGYSGLTCTKIRDNNGIPVTCKLDTGGSSGDPHVTTADGYVYHPQSAGEFLYATDNRTFTAQIRTAQWGGTRTSVQTAFALDMGDLRIGIYANQNPALRINGAPAVIPCAASPVPVNGSLCNGRISFENGSWLTHSNGRFSIYLTDRVSHFDVWSGSYQNTQFYASPRLRGQIHGFLGNFNGDRNDDLQTRDGTVLPLSTSYADLHGLFANSWRLSQAESKFDYLPGQNSTTFTDLNFPGTFAAPTLTLAERDAAAATCIAAGVAADKLEGCILDVALIGDQAAKDFILETLF